DLAWHGRLDAAVRLAAAGAGAGQLGPGAAHLQVELAGALHHDPVAHGELVAAASNGDLVVALAEALHLRLVAGFPDAELWPLRVLLLRHEVLAAAEAEAVAHVNRPPAPGSARAGPRRRGGGGRTRPRRRSSPCSAGTGR